MRKKIKKLVCILSAVVIAFSCFCVSVSADSSYFYEFPFFKLGSNNRMIMDGVSYGAAGVMNVDGIDFYFWNWLPAVPGAHTYQMQYLFASPLNISGNSNYKLVFENDINFYLSDLSLFNYGSFSFELIFEDSLSDDFTIPVPSNFEITNSGGILHCNYSSFLSQPCSFLGFRILFIMSESSEHSSVANYRYGFYTNSPIIIYLGPDTSEEDYLLNGGHSSAPYEPFDNSEIEKHDEIVSDIDEKTLEARSSTISFFNNFGALLNDTPVQRGLLAVSKIFTEFLSIGWLAGLIQFGLGIGAFAFILGSVIMVVGRISSNSAKSERASERRRKK